MISEFDKQTMFWPPAGRGRFCKTAPCTPTKLLLSRFAAKKNSETVYQQEIIDV